MALNVKISSNLQPSSEPIRVSVVDPKISVKVSGPSTKMIEYKLDMRRALNGDIMVFDHKEIDIIVLVEKKKPIKNFIILCLIRWKKVLKEWIL